MELEASSQRLPEVATRSSSSRHCPGKASVVVPAASDLYCQLPQLVLQVLVCQVPKLFLLQSHLCRRQLASHLINEILPLDLVVSANDLPTKSAAQSPNAGQSVLDSASRERRTVNAPISHRTDGHSRDLPPHPGADGTEKPVATPDASDSDWADTLSLINGLCVGSTLACVNARREPYATFYVRWYLWMVCVSAANTRADERECCGGRERERGGN